LIKDIQHLSYDNMLPVNSSQPIMVW